MIRVGEERNHRAAGRGGLRLHRQTRRTRRMASRAGGGSANDRGSDRRRNEAHVRPHVHGATDGGGQRVRRVRAEQANRLQDDVGSGSRGSVVLFEAVPEGTRVTSTDRDGRVGLSEPRGAADRGRLEARDEGSNPRPEGPAGESEGRDRASPGDPVGSRPPPGAVTAQNAPAQGEGLGYPLRHQLSVDLGRVRGRTLRRGHHRRRPQRPRQRGLPRPGRDEDARPRAAPRPRRRGGHRGDLPGLPILGLLVRRVAPPPRDHPRAPAASARPRHPAARRDVHPAPRGSGPAGAAATTCGG